jgi:hypothetical protein
MNRPDRNDFDEKEIYKYITLLEEYADHLESENDAYGWEVNSLEMANNDLISENEELEEEIDELKNSNTLYGNSILDEMTRDWLSNENNWETVKQIALKQN